MRTRLVLLASFLVAVPVLANDNFQSVGTSTAVHSAGVKAAAGVPLYFSSGGAATTKDGVTMREQALANMKRLEANIATAGFTLGDVMFVRAYLTPGADGSVDYAGWDKAWSEVFNNPKNPNKPARTTVAVPMLNQNGGLIELEYVCATRDPAKMAAGSRALALPVTNPNLTPYGTKEGRIYAGMGIMPGSGLYWTSGNNPPVINKDAPLTSYENRGDMHTQAHNTLVLLKDNLAGVGLTLADVVYVRAFLGPDGNMGGKFDFDGWNKAYSEFFNTPDQPHKPARVTATTPTFAGNAGGQPNTMIEIEFVAAFPKAPALFDGPGAVGPPHTLLRDYGASTAMVASGIAVKPGAALYLSEGALPTGGGDMKTQALSTLESLKSHLAEAGASFRDVVFLRAYLVPGADGSVDRDGWNAAYTTFFNNPGQPHKPARVTIPVSSLPKSDSKIAIDLIAVVP